VSDIPTDWRGQLDLRAELARIDRDRADMLKLQAETKKFNRDPWILVLAALLGIVAAIAARAPEIIQALR
jgi:hypothetical protein